MENQLFVWKSCRSDGFGTTTYFEVCLTWSIGIFEAGTVFDSAIIDYEKATLDLSSGDKTYKFKLVISAI